MPEAVVNDPEVGLITTSTGTSDAARVVALSGNAGDDVVVAVLLMAQ
jgi:hypothetical protein